MASLLVEYIFKILGNTKEFRKRHVPAYRQHGTQTWGIRWQLSLLSGIRQDLGKVNVSLVLLAGEGPGSFHLMESPWGARTELTPSGEHGR